MTDKKILYLSYDGMTDPLGQSQVLPYLQGLSKEGYRFTILSFEKKERFKTQKEKIYSLMSGAGIEWVPLSFTKHPPILSKFYDAVRMRKKAFALQRERKFDMVHCRSYIAANIGLEMKKKTGIKFFFDMRGFWADEKRDGGAWKDDHPVFKRVYKYYKRKEAEYLQNADHIISLTEAAKSEIQTWATYNPAVAISVIPCCADMAHFSLTNADQKQVARKQLNIGNDRLVISYLGSIGSWYMIDEMLRLFTYIKKEYPNAFFLFISHSDRNYIRQKAAEYSIAESDMMVMEASRQEVPHFVKASDINISFIKPVYSKMSSSPTKLGEVLAMGIPVIVNAGVGDVETIVNSTGSGIALKNTSIQAMEDAVKQIPYLLQLNAVTIREKSGNIFDLDRGISLYEKAYRETFN